MTVTGSSAETEVTERDAREVAEEARETEWRKPSFAKELFLGRFRLDLVHPAPTGRPSERRARARRSSSGCATSARRRRRGRDRAGGQIPDEVVQGLEELGAFGMKIPQEYGGLGPVPASTTTRR